jgi:three-Cys-motif partner protein
MGVELDEIGRWSEIKLDIIREYATPYSQILAKQPRLYHIYIDGFAGAGICVSKTTGEQVAGSPINVTSVRPRFKEYHLVELDADKASFLRELFQSDSDVFVHEGNCNQVLRNTLLPEVRYADYKRAFCLLDPYGLHLDWRVVKMAGGLRTIDLLINFPIMDMNMNVLWHDPASVDLDQAARMTLFWGDDTWRNAAYRQEPVLFGTAQIKTGNEPVVRAYVERLKSHAGFQFATDPLPMRNTTNAIVYYLVFASQKASAHKIMTDIFRKRHVS